MHHEIAPTNQHQKERHDQDDGGRAEGGWETLGRGLLPIGHSADADQGAAIDAPVIPVEENPHRPTLAHLKFFFS